MSCYLEKKFISDLLIRTSSKSVMILFVFSQKLMSRLQLLQYEIQLSI